MIQTWHTLKLKHPSAGVIYAGDANELDWQLILNHDKNLRQIVLDPTRGKNILDVCITDLWNFYQRPVIVPPIVVDDNKKGEPSNHSGVLMKPKEEKEEEIDTVVKTVQPMPESLIIKFGEIICKEN